MHSWKSQALHILLYAFWPIWFWYLDLSTKYDNKVIEGYLFVEELSVSQSATSFAAYTNVHINVSAKLNEFPHIFMKLWIFPLSLCSGSLVSEMAVRSRKDVHLGGSRKDVHLGGDKYKFSSDESGDMLVILFSRLVNARSILSLSRISQIIAIIIIIKRLILFAVLAWVLMPYILMD